MPHSAPHPCNYPACPRVTRERFCPDHATRVDHGRLNASRRGYTSAAWRALRASILMRDPLCRSCHGAPSTHADHVVARANGGTDAPSNLQGLCASCHSRKTAREDGGFGNAARVSA